MKKTNYDYVYGIHAVKQLFEYDIDRVLEVWIQEGRQDDKIQQLLNVIQEHQLAVQSVPRKTLDKLSNEGIHQGVVVRCKPLQRLDQTDLAEILDKLDQQKIAPFLLILDEIQDPHNLGACLRTADAAGVHAVIVPRSRACHITPIVRKVACGAAESMPLIEASNLASMLRWLKERNIWLVGTTGAVNKTLYDVDLTTGLAVVLGAEGTGIRHLTAELCDTLVSIPMYGAVESLNVSVANAICLYEVVRQRRLIPKI